MGKDNVYAKIREILISQFRIESDLIQPDKLLYDDLGLDSLDTVDLLLYLNGNIAGNPDPAIFKTARTVQDLVDTVYPLCQPAGEKADN